MTTNAPPNAHHLGRRALADWQHDRPQNYWHDNDFLGSLGQRLGLDPGSVQRLSDFGQAVVAAEPWVARCSQEPGTPLLERWDAIGRRIERVRFDEAYHAWGRVVYASGVMAITGQPGRAVEQALLMLLSSHHGEAGHNCPLACTAGLIKVLQQVAHPALQQALLPGLLDADYDRRLHGSQFLTEVQGGSDVGANACVAVPQEAGAAEQPARYRIHGEKWFCSVVDAPLYLMTARPEGAPDGTKGLGLFLVPHDLPPEGSLEVGPLPPLGATPGEVNHLRIRRLKNKMGTRAMASGELDFDGALAWQLGPLEHGFRNAVEIVLGTSRVFNALACSGSMWRAWWEASRFARHRRAFGRPIEAFSAVGQSLGQLWVEAAAATAGTLDLVVTEGTGQHGDALRLAVNANKYWTSVRNTQMVRLAMEVLGGNGTIEDFSALPRLYRDAMVTESWEGTHNVLAAQTLRDMQKLQLHESWLDWLAPRVEHTGDRRLAERLASVRADAKAIVERSDALAPLRVRVWLENASVLHQAVCLVEGAVAPAALGLWLALHPHRPTVVELGWQPT
jgi:alkylation response protein AidB-like acyl-CoA dehydrogenase